jgi:hypothetical protein
MPRPGDSSENERVAVAEELLQGWLSGQNKLQRKVVRNEPEFP